MLLCYVSRRLLEANIVVFPINKDLSLYVPQLTTRKKKKTAAPSLYSKPLQHIAFSKNIYVYDFCFCFYKFMTALNTQFCSWTLSCIMSIFSIFTS